MDHPLLKSRVEAPATACATALQRLGVRVLSRWYPTVYARSAYDAIQVNFSYGLMLSCAGFDNTVNLGALFLPPRNPAEAFERSR
jgi:hypothetical protein